MKKITILLTAIIAMAISASAQVKSNLIFFTEEGEKFFVIMDGIRQNDVAQTNVRLTGVMGTYAKVKVIFDDQTLGEINDNIQWKESSETTYNIRKKKTGAANSVKKAGDWAGKDLGTKSDTAKFKPVDEKYVIRWYKDVPMEQAAPVMQNDPSVVVYHTQPTTTIITQTTTQTPVDGQNVNVNMNVGGAGVGMDVHYSETQTQTTQQTTVLGGSQTTTTVVQQQPDHYVMQGYNGRIGCPWPMDNGSFQSAKSSINSKSFESDKLTIAKQILGSNCLTCDQVRDIMNLFTFEDSKLDFAKFAYGHTYDLGNYYKLNDAFTFSSSIDDLNAYIQAQH